MKRPKTAKSRRGTTLVEVLVAVALMALIFLFLTAELIQTTQAENLASNHSQTITAANYLLGVMKGDNTFWGPDWGTGPLTPDPCGTPYPSYTDSITTPTWHPLCDLSFPELAGSGVHAQFMWNAQIQAGDPNVAQLTLWVMTDEGGRNDLYELHATRMQTAPAPAYSPSLAPGSGAPPCPPCPSTSPGSSSPKPKPSPTKTATPSPTPSPTGIFE